MINISKVIVKFKPSPPSHKTVGKITFEIEEQAWCSFTIMSGQYGLFFKNTTQKYKTKDGEEKENVLNIMKQKDGTMARKILEYITDQDAEEFAEDLDVILEREVSTEDSIPDDDKFPF